MYNINDDIERVYYSNEEIDKRCREIADKINHDYDGKNPVLIALLKGSLNFFACLQQYITIPCTLDYMRAKSYAGTESTGNVAITLKPSQDLTNRDVIIVEDIVDTGATLFTIMELMKHEYRPNSLEICVMLDKEERRIYRNFECKYIAFACPNAFVVGFGLDYDEQYRQLPYIGVLKEEIYNK